MERCHAARFSQSAVLILAAVWGGGTDSLQLTETLGPGDMGDECLYLCFMMTTSYMNLSDFTAENRKSAVLTHKVKYHFILFADFLKGMVKVRDPRHSIHREIMWELHFHDNMLLYTLQWLLVSFLCFYFDILESKLWHGQKESL